MFDLKEINEELIQIYGSINGVAMLKVVNGQKRWQFKINFIKNKSLIKVSSNEKDGTIWNKEILKERILEAYNY